MTAQPPENGPGSAGPARSPRPATARADDARRNLSQMDNPLGYKGQHGSTSVEVLIYAPGKSDPRVARHRHELRWIRDALPSA